MDDWKRFVLTRKKLADGKVGSILWEVEGEDHPECKDIADRCHAYKTYRPRWNCVLNFDGILLYHRCHNLKSYTSIFTLFL
jgi:hypothetical protein